MFDFSTLIGLEINKAKTILNQNEYFDITEINNSSSSENCNITLVCAVRENNGAVTLVCGSFLRCNGD